MDAEKSVLSNVLKSFLNLGFRANGQIPLPDHTLKPIRCPTLVNIDIGIG